MSTETIIETAPDNLPTPDAPAEPAAAAPTTDEIIAYAREYVERKGQGKGMHQKAMLVMSALVDASAAESAPATTPDAPSAPDAPANAAPAYALPDAGPGSFEAITRNVVANDDGTAIHLSRSANRDYSRREAIALALDILRKVHAVS